MCGIVGGNLYKSREEINDVLRHLEHRGPDASGIFLSSQSTFWLGHSRLSIVDLSEQANQPFESLNQSYICAYNGELYNHKELAAAQGLKLRTTSDTEVVVELFSSLGPKAVNRFNGMFALAIYDLQKEELHLFRDRIGIKPLYFFNEGDSFAFASELPALKSLVGNLEVNREALSLFLHRGYIPEPLTFYKNIFKFPAGAHGVVKNGKLNIERYWRAEDYIKESTLSSEKVVLDQIEELLRDSIKLRLMSDVPYGSFLSGGADSGLITAMATDLCDEPIHCFNVSFEDAVFDESPYAKAMSDHLGAKYHHIRVTKKQVMEDLDSGMDLVGEPFADSSVFPTMAISRFAARHVKMVLSGDGGDELFMGYGAYNWAERLTKHWTYRKMLASVLRATGKARNKRAANVFDCASKHDMQAHIFSQEQNLFSGKEIEKILRMKFKDPYVANPGSRPFSPAEEQAFFDLTNYLKDDLLVKVDRASMRYGLEARVPFLDHRLVELSLNIDPVLKRKNGESKYLIKKIMERYYPKELIYRKKWGFSIPLEKWMKSTILEAKSSEPYINQAFKDLGYKYTLKANGYLYNRLYALMILSRYI